MSPVLLLLTVFFTLMGLILVIVCTSRYKITLIKLFLLCLIWAFTFCFFVPFPLFIISGMVATFLTLVILGKLEPRKESKQTKFEEK